MVFSFENVISGPYTQDYAKTFAREHQGAYCWHQGFSDWIPVYQATEIRPMKKDGVTPFPATPATMMSPKPTELPVSNRPVTHDIQSSGGFGQQSVTEGIDFDILPHLKEGDS